MISRRALIFGMIVSGPATLAFAGGSEEYFTQDLRGDALYQATVDKLIEGANDLRFDRGEAAMSLSEEFEVRNVYEGVKNRLAEERDDPYSLNRIKDATVGERGDGVSSDDTGIFLLIGG